MPRNTLIQVRRDTAANWSSVNPTLASGEMGFETDTGKFKIGTGSTIWNSLPYTTDTSATDASDITGTTLAPNVVSSSLTSVGTLNSGSVPTSLLTGTTLPVGVVSSSLTSVGTLSSLNVDGTITATTFSSGSYKVGDTGPGGGIIFFVDRFNEYADFTYLEVAPVGTDVTRTWAQSTPTNYQSTAVTGADSRGLGGGYQNTIDIVNQGNSNTATCAAKYCDSLVSGGQSDWYLPSIGELKLVNDIVFIQLGVGGFSASNYWSSSEYSGVNSVAWYQMFISGGQSNGGKSNLYNVRAIRRF